MKDEWSWVCDMVDTAMVDGINRGDTLKKILFEDPAKRESLH